MKPTTTLPDDPQLPGLAAIRSTGLAPAIPALGLSEESVELLLHGYTRGQRAALEARTAHRRVAIKAYASDPVLEVGLYQALAAAGLAGGSGVRVPQVLAWDGKLCLEVISWLEGPTAQELVGRGQGRRAGELAAQWLQCAAGLPVKLGPPLGAAQMLERSRKWVAKLIAADPALGNAASELLGILEQTRPKEGAPHLLHGSLYARHVIDLGDGPGLIDWDNFGEGPLELDAGMFLTTVWRLGWGNETKAKEAASAIESFLAATAGLLDERALAWHRAVALLHLAERGCKPIPRRQDDWKERARAMLEEATRLVAGRRTVETVEPSNR